MSASSLAEDQAAPRGIIAHLLAKLGSRRKRQVLNRFFEVMEPDPGQVVLDLGGPSHDDGMLAHWFSRIVVVNSDHGAFRGELFENLRPTPHHDFIIGDGCNLPFQSGSCDYIFCDQVIEHIARGQRSQFIGEILRVASKGYMLSTPNYHFPFEPHYHVPLMQHLPESLKRKLVFRTTLGWMNAESYHPIQLLTKSELRELLPGGHVEGFAFGPWMPETLVVWARLKREA